MKELKWEGVVLHAETLIVGVITLASVIALAPSMVSLSGVLSNEFIAGFVFIVASYVVGSITIVLSRPVVKWRSDPRRRRKIGPDKEYRDTYQEAIADGNNEVLVRRQRARIIRGSLFPLWLIAWAILLSLDLPDWIELRKGGVAWGVILMGVIGMVVIYFSVVCLLVEAEKSLHEEASRAKPNK